MLFYNGVGTLKLGYSPATRKSDRFDMLLIQEDGEKMTVFNYVKVSHRGRLAE